MLSLLRSYELLLGHKGDQNGKFTVEFLQCRDPGSGGGGHLGQLGSIGQHGVADWGYGGYQDNRWLRGFCC